MTDETSAKINKTLEALNRQMRQNTQRLERLLAHQMWAHLGDDPVVEFPYHAETIRLHLPDGWFDAVQRLILTTRTFYEEQLLNVLRQRVPPGLVVVDAGANIGNHTVYFAKMCKAAAVHAFEPMPHVAAILRRNAELNAPDRIKVHPYALGAAEETAGITIFNASNLGSTTLRTDTDGDIPVRPLDAFGIENVGLIKIDVEGMQDAVLDGAAETIAASKPILVIEAFEKTGERARTEAVLHKMGYAVEEVMGHNIIAVPG